jgi:MoxR-like ATPase
MTNANADLTPDRERELIGRLRQMRSQIDEELSRVIVGQKDVVRQLLVSLLAGGNCLITGAPGLAKTLLVKSIAQLFDLKFNRIQFTPDLMPADITGTEVLEEDAAGTRNMRFIPGPIFANVLLADEINRATPRTQSALLEAMNDFHVTVDRRTHALPSPFFVIATQNPYEFEGTYPLPENQLDRFMLCLQIGYPDRTSEREILINHRQGEPVDALQPVLTPADLTELQQAVRDVRVNDSINDYILDLVAATRSHQELTIGVSTRGALTLYRATQALALCEGRDYAIPDDITRLAIPVLAHRVQTIGAIREGQRRRAQQVIRQLLGQVPVRA